MEDVKFHQVMAESNASFGAQTGNASVAATGKVALPGGGPGGSFVVSVGASVGTGVGAGVASSGNNSFLLFFVRQFFAEAGGDDFPERFLTTPP